MTDRTDDRWLVSWGAAAGSRTRLICIGHAGTGASLFRPWRDWLPEEIEVRALRLPGRESRVAEEPIDEMPELVRRAADSLCGELETDFALFGSCSGGIIAFELARELRRQARAQPSRLLIAAQVAPKLRAAEGASHAVGLDLETRIRQLGGTDSTILQNPEMMEILAPALRADFHLTDHYKYAEEPPLECPITIFAGDRDPFIDIKDLEAWKSETRSSFDLLSLEGDHFFSGPSSRKLAEAVGRSLLSS